MNNATCPFCGADITGAMGYSFLSAHLEECDAFRDELGHSALDDASA